MLPVTTTAPALGALALALAFAVAGCGGDRAREPAARTPALAAPEVPGESEEFKEMKLPPGQLARVLPVGAAWPAEEGPVYRSHCLRCHSVSQTVFAVRDWRESLHARAGVLCAACHGTHESGFVPHPGPERCTMCHAQQVEEFLASAHGPERSPGMRCVSCHDAHATDRAAAKSVAVCVSCHLQSGHVQGFAASRMGEIAASGATHEDGTPRAPDCVYCHQPASALMKQTGDFRNDRVTLHDPAITVAKDPRDRRRLAPETIQFLLPLCVTCHSERNARHRLENSDPMVLHWTPAGMPDEVRRRPEPGARTPGGPVAPGTPRGGAR